ncbi:MAG: uncharacterized protein PWQ96_590 [Clostridia bacterium]|jgi:hypothetical protein|nr:uncharacterized protein [Clostridia bacterium]
MCVGCREKKYKRELLRIVRTPEGITKIDRSGKMSGRGAYVCSQKKCLEKAIKSNALKRALQADLSPEVLEDLKEQLENQDE